MSWESQSMALLSASLARPFVLAAAAWLVLRIFRVRHPASKHAVWSVVLAAMLLLPLVSVATPHWHLPVLPAKHEAFTAPQPLQAIGPPEEFPAASQATPRSEARSAFSAVAQHAGGLVLPGGVVGDAALPSGGVGDAAAGCRKVSAC